MLDREHALNLWLQQQFPHQTWTLTPISGDASFRQYSRLNMNGKQFVIMDAPPEKEPLDAFLSIQNLLKHAEITVPECYAENRQQGFLIISDFGDQLLFHTLTPENASPSYQKAIQILLKLHNIDVNSIPWLPKFDAQHIQQELSLLTDWFLKHYLQLHLSHDEAILIQQTFDALKLALTTQPQVFIHRDYHSRNIMPLPSQHLGIIDFQDAMMGPWTYDLVSLLKDCYLRWDLKQIQSWMQYFYDHSIHAQQRRYEDFVQDFELCGLQRHLKVLGIFVRLSLRDHKHQYLQDLPLTFQYVMECLEKQPQFESFYHFMQQRVAPEFEKRQQG
jgi:aminoglycoside/choline kinase family phosphotransferase